MNTQKVLIGGVVLAVLLGVFALVKATNISIPSFQAGAVPTLDGVDSPYVKINGVRTAYVSQGMIATSSTICSIRNPFTGTSTVIALSANISSGIIGTNGISVSTSTNSYATSTQFFVLDHQIPSQTIDAFSWTPFFYATTSTPRLIGTTQGVNFTGENPVQISGTQFINFRLATSTAAAALASYYQGQCSVIFEKL